MDYCAGALDRSGRQAVSLITGTARIKRVTMNITILNDKQALGRAAAEKGAALLRAALSAKKEISIIVATGASQFEMLEVLITEKDIDWSRITVFHLDEYIGLPVTHPASFRKYLRERLVARVPNLKEFVEVNGSATDINAELARLGKLISAGDIDVCFAGIGENGHLAFNDPPADFETDAPYIVVDLDEACRRQQLGEGWFPTLNDVPAQAISMSIRQIMKSKAIVLSVPDERKSEAVKNCVEGTVSNLHPASILQRHENCLVFLDAASASKLKR